MHNLTHFLSSLVAKASHVVVMGFSRSCCDVSPIKFLWSLVLSEKCGIVEHICVAHDKKFSRRQEVL